MGDLADALAAFKLPLSKPTLNICLPTFPPDNESIVLQKSRSSEDLILITIKQLLSTSKSLLPRAMAPLPAGIRIAQTVGITASAFCSGGQHLSAEAPGSSSLGRL